MTRSCFQEFMKTLYSYYGKAQVKDQEAHKAYFDALAFLPDTEREFLYRGVVRNFRFFPTLPELLEIANMRRQAQAPVKNQVRCEYCMDTGVIPYQRKGFAPFRDQEYDFWASCPKCAVGKALEGPYPPMDQLFGEEALEQVRQRNRRLYGDLSPETVEKSRETVKAYLRGVA